MKNSSLFVLVTILLLLSVSCSKTDTDLQPPVHSNGDFLALASVKDSRLHFATQNDLQKYYAGIDDLLRKTNNGDSLLKSIESNYNYLPLRNINHLREEDSTIEYTESEIARLIEMDFIKDEIRRSVLNQYYEVEVGDSVYVFFGKDQVFRMSADNFQGISNFRQTDKGASLFPFKLMDDGVTLISKTKFFTRIEDIETDFVLKATYTSSACNAFDKEFDFEIEVDGGQPSGQFTTFTINWGHNNQTSTFTMPSGGLFNIAHTFPSSAAPFTVTCTATFVDILMQPVSVTSTQFVSVGVPCTDGEDSFEQNSPIVNNRRMGYCIWFCHDIFGTHAGSFTHGWRLKNNGNLVREAGQLSTTIHFVFRDNNCISQDNGQETDDCNNCQKKRAARQCWFSRRSLSNGEVNSEHSATFSNGQSFTQTITIDPC